MWPEPPPRSRWSGTTALQTWRIVALPSQPPPSILAPRTSKMIDRLAHTTAGDPFATQRGVPNGPVTAKDAR